MNNYIKLKNGELISFDDINEKVPFTFVRLSPIHYEVCNFIADNFYTFRTKNERKVLLNYLTQRSAKTKFITAIILLGKKEKIDEINVDFMNSSFSIFFDENPIIHDGKKLLPYIDLGLKRIVSKVLLNKLYFFLRKRRPKETTSVIRTWVDVNETQFKNEFEDSLILIYPFATNFRRGLKYIKHCFASYENVSLNGINYSWIKLLKLLFASSKNKDNLLLELEITANKKHFKFFEKFNKIFTADEYMPAIYALYEERSSNQIVMNDMHGIGFYNPFINYTHIKVFNRQQKDYYLKRNPGIIAEVKNHIPEVDPTTIAYNSIVYIDQGDLSKYKLIYENLLQKRVKNQLKIVSDKVNVFIKFHPNRSATEQKYFKEKYPFFNVINSFDLDKKYLFINLYSTSYYDYNKFGSFIFIEEDFFNPSLFFGDEIKKSSVENLNNYLSNYNFK